MKFTQSNSKLLSNNVNQIAIDSYGMVWVATDNGLSMYNPTDSSFTNYFVSQNITSIASGTNGQLIAYTSDIGYTKTDSMFYFDGSVWHSYFINSYIKSTGYVNSSIVDPSNSFVFGSDSGVKAVYNNLNNMPIFNANGTVYNSPINANSINYTLNDTTNEQSPIYWFGVKDSLVQWEVKAVGTANSLINKYYLGGGIINSIDKLNNDTLITSTGIGIFLFDINTKHRTALKTFNNKYGISFSAKKDSAENIWAVYQGTSGQAVTRINNNGGSFNTFSYTLNFFFDVVHDMEVGKQVYIGSGSGFTVFDPNATPDVIVQTARIGDSLSTINITDSQYQWYYNTDSSSSGARVSALESIYSPISGADSNIYVATLSGWYRVQIISATDTTWSVPVRSNVQSTTTAVIGSVQNQDIMVYPNPNNGHFSIKSEDMVINVTLVNQFGQSETNKIETMNPELNTSLKGMIIAEISTEKGTIIKKLIIE